MPGNWIATVVTCLLILREDSVARLAARHTSLKRAGEGLSIALTYHVQVIIEVPGCGGLQYCDARGTPRRRHLRGQRHIVGLRGSLGKGILGRPEHAE